MSKGKIKKPEICYECKHFRVRTSDDSYLCINPDADNRTSVGKATRACTHAELNPKLVEIYPETYEL